MNPPVTSGVITEERMKMNNIKMRKMRIKCFYLILLIDFQTRMCETEEIININATRGGNATLSLPQREIMQNIIYTMWVRFDSNHFATTSPIKNITIREDDYLGRLDKTNDTSLIIINVTAKDQGVYSATVVFPGDNYIQKYNLSILEKTPDPITSNDIKSSTTDVCSVTCRRNGINVTLTCDQTSHQDISMYDPDTCSCAAWKEDCAPCVLDKYCRKDDGTVRLRVVVAVPVAVALVLVVVMLVIMLVPLKPRHKSSLV